MNDYKNDNTGEWYRDISREKYPDWDGWQEIDRHKDMYGFPENIKFSNILEMRYYEFTHKEGLE